MADVGTGRLVFLDTNVFIYHLSAHPRYVPLTTALLQRVESGILSALTTSITLSELLVMPARVGDEQAMVDYESFLVNFPNLRVVAIDNDVAREAARIRASSAVRTPDALQLAAASVYDADLIVTNDRGWRALPQRPKVLLLNAYAG